MNLKYGELFLPMHLPFAYDESPRQNSAGQIYDQFGNIETSDNYSGPDYWGNNSETVKDISRIIFIFLKLRLRFSISIIRGFNQLNCNGLKQSNN